VCWNNSVSSSGRKDRPLARSLKQRLLAGGGWVIVGKIITASATYALSPLLTRLMSRAEFGAYGAALNLVTVAAMFAQLGLHQAVVRLIAESLGTDRAARARAAIGKVFRWCAVGIGVTGGGLAAGGGAWLAEHAWDRPDLAEASVGIGIWVAALAVQYLSSETFRGFQDLRNATLFGGVITSLLTLTTFTVLWFGAGSTSLGQVVVIGAGTTAISATLGLFAVRRRTRELPAGGTMPSGELAKLALPLWVGSVTTFALMRFDGMILLAFCSADDVGIYYGAANHVNLVSTTLMLANLVVPPFIAELYAQGKKQKLERVLRNVATLAGLPAFLVLLFLVTFGGPLLARVLGEDYRAGGTILAILAVGRLINVWTGSCGFLLAMTGFQSVQMKITIVYSILVVSGCFLVVRPFGVIGVAITVSVGMALQNLTSWVAARRCTGIWTHASIPRLADIKSLLGR